jgi:hypothetical protein
MLLVHWFFSGEEERALDGLQRAIEAGLVGKDWAGRDSDCERLGVLLWTYWSSFACIFFHDAGRGSNF